jgi:hypothetical protein
MMLVHRILVDEGEMSENRVPENVLLGFGYKGNG